MTAPILPGATLGVFGGGQLGRMFAMAARRLGYRIHVFAPEEETPAGQVADLHVRAAYEDLEAVARFTKAVDVVTFEFENIPSETLAAAAAHALVRPGGALLETTQHRWREKSALRKHGIPTAPFARIDGPTDIEQALSEVGLPGVLKTASWGYDGKGQRRVADEAALRAAVDEAEGRPLILEGFIHFEAELSVVGARGADGQVALYEPAYNHHENHILDISVNPAPLPPGTTGAAFELTRHVLEAFDVVGVLCVEMFLLPDGSLLVNELAPRPHNSGHLTIDAHHCSQFEQQVRTICGLPLGSTVRAVPAVAMANLLGDLWADGTPDWSKALSDPAVRLHLYGKSDARPGRKMGHLTVVADSAQDAVERARAARRRITPTLQET